MRAQLLLVALAVLALPACATDTAAGNDEPPKRLTVSAAASLRYVFATLGEQFEDAHPGVDVAFNPGPSSSLAEQVMRGAPVDRFAAADADTMQRVVEAGRAGGEPQLFARNVLQIAVPRDNPGRVTGIADFARRDLIIGLCAEQVPCGRAAARALAAAGVAAQPDTREQDVTALLTKVQLGEVDAGLVYRTDILAAGERVRGMEFSQAAAAVNDYLIVPVRESSSRAEAAAFVEYLLSARGRAALAAAGFRTP